MRKYSNEYVERHIFEKNGVLLDKYVSCKSNINIKCNICEFIWSATFDNIKNKDSWCPKCARCANLTIQDAINAASIKNGKCISTEYVNIDSSLNWQCSYGHEWSATLYHIKNDSWCPVCSRKKRLSITHAQEVAKSKGGQCLSEEYINNRNHLLWKCSDGHKWKATLAKVKYETWCPQCKNKTQAVITNIIKDIFPGFDVISNYRGFDWLRTKKNRRQEVDIFVPELKLAIEYDGEQHFLPIKRFGGNKGYKRVKRLDANKNKKIAEHPECIRFFIRFNYTERTKLCKEYINKRLVDAGII